MALSSSSEKLFGTVSDYSSPLNDAFFLSNLALYLHPIQHFPLAETLLSASASLAVIYNGVT